MVYWKWRTYEETKELAEQRKGNIAPCVPFARSVFNFDQVEGIARPPDDLPPDKDRRLELAESVFAGMPDRPEISYQLRRNPSYSSLRDCLTLPHPSQFERAEAYYAVLFQELTRATGHPKRLNRFGVGEGTQPERYSVEELVTELGTAFLCAHTGLGNPMAEARHASAIAGWATAFRKDARLVVRAASAAQRATDYIRGIPRPAQREADE